VHANQHKAEKPVEEKPAVEESAAEDVAYTCDLRRVGPFGGLMGG